MALGRVDHTMECMQFRIYEGIHGGQVEVKALVDAEVVDDESLEADIFTILESNHSGGNESRATGQEELKGLGELHGGS
jgi:hypothetical protein